MGDHNQVGEGQGNQWVLLPNWKMTERMESQAGFSVESSGVPAVNGFHVELPVPLREAMVLCFVSGLV